MLQAEAAVQADWAAYLHGKYLHYKSGSLGPLGLSSSLADSLWAISMVRSRTFSGELGSQRNHVVCCSQSSSLAESLWAISMARSRTF
jgi:hypothetical protein